MITYLTGNLIRYCYQARTDNTYAISNILVMSIKKYGLVLRRRLKGREYARPKYVLILGILNDSVNSSGLNRPTYHCNFYGTQPAPPASLTYGNLYRYIEAWVKPLKTITGFHAMITIFA